MKPHKLLGMAVAFLLPFSVWAHHDHRQADGLSNVTVLIIRHAEKPDHGRGLSLEGQRRAVAYAGYFDPLRLSGNQTLLPQRLIATRDSKSSERPHLTLVPLAERLRLPVEQQWGDHHVDELVQALRAKNSARVILIAWHHGQMVHLLRAFGATPDELLNGESWPGDVYNWLVVLHFGEGGELLPKQSHRVQEHLMPGD